MNLNEARTAGKGGVSEIMTCDQISDELVERARRGVELGADAATHLSGCDSCRDLWKAQCELTAHLRAVKRANVSAIDETGGAWNKAVIMREFDSNRRRERQVRWMWAMSSAAVLMLSVVAVRDVWVRPSASRTLVSGSSVVHAAYPLREYTPESFAPAEEAGEKGFTAVPFALPPAPGETFGIVRTQLDPADLARMGVSVDPGWTGTIQADLLVGQDGFTQAVRLSNDDTEEEN